jgi:hypothetical protein
MLLKTGLALVTALSFAFGAKDDAKADDKAKADNDGFVSLFNGKDLTGWQGDTKGYVVKDGVVVCEKGTNLFTEKEYSDFVFKFEFLLPPGGNSGLGIHAPLEGNAAYDGIESQILDDMHAMYQKPGEEIKDWQYHGSLYGIVAAKKGALKPQGEWNSEIVTVHGPHIKIELNGVTIVDANIEEATKNGTLDGEKHPGLARKSGYIGFLGHGDPVSFRGMAVKELK